MHLEFEYFYFRSNSFGIGHLHDGVILLSTARILFVFPFAFKFGNATEV